jgi:very-short-patch-repair endonuclease
VISRSEAIAAGMSDDSIFRLIRSGEWNLLLPGVIRVSRGQSDWHQALAAACKWAGERASASHYSAAPLWGFEGFPPGVVEISAPTKKDARGLGFCLHTIGILEPSEITAISNIPVTSATRTLFDLAAVADPNMVELALEDALRRRLTSIPRMKWFMDVHAKQGRRGITAMRRLLAAKERRVAITESGFEIRLFQELRRADLPLPVPQYVLSENGKTLARLDFAYPEARLGLEAVSYKWHSARDAWARDQSRWNDVVALGWRVLNVTWDDLKNRPAHVVATIGRALGYSDLFGQDRA